jgi:hypothetical protein
MWRTLVGLGRDPISLLAHDVLSDLDQVSGRRQHPKGCVEKRHYRFAVAPRWRDITSRRPVVILGAIA